VKIVKICGLFSAIFHNYSNVGNYSNKMSDKCVTMRHSFDVVFLDVNDYNKKLSYNRDSARCPP